MQVLDEKGKKVASYTINLVGQFIMIVFQWDFYLRLKSFCKLINSLQAKSKLPFKTIELLISW